MQTLTLLGTGNATSTKYYNTCFAIRTGDEYLLVDAGGGNGILIQLEKSGIPLTAIRHVFVSHAHPDHLLGVLWILRLIAVEIQKGRYRGSLGVYCHRELTEQIETIARIVLPEKSVALFGDSIRLIPVDDGGEAELSAGAARFLDVGSDKLRQFGFILSLRDGKRLVFLGDEPYRGARDDRMAGADWLLHEAFCLYRERDLFQPYEKHHVTVKEACEAAAGLGVRNLVLYHTEDTHVQDRKRLYAEEGGLYYGGNIHVPEDLEIISL